MKVKNSKRLDSIKISHKLERVHSSTRIEDYSKIISELVELNVHAITLSISRYMSVSVSSITKRLQRSDDKRILEYEKYH